jgi:uroporphyrinogen-III synthase
MLNEGFEVISFPMIEVSESELNIKDKNNIANTKEFDWLIFTSKNGVLYFLKAFEKITGVKFKKVNSKVAVIGKKTGMELQQNGIQPDYISKSNLAEKFVIELKNSVIEKGASVLLLLGNLAGKLMEDEFADIYRVSRVNCYFTYQPDVKKCDVTDRIFSNNYEMIIFTSSSGFENFVVVADKFSFNLSKLRVASIGKSTTKTMSKWGVTPVFTANQSNLEGIVNEIKYYINKTEL